jgi:hypothetical protein
MNPVLLCVMVHGVALCAPSLGSGTDGLVVELFEKYPCPDCTPAATTAVFRGADSCVMTVNGTVVASARKATLPDSTAINDFVDVSVRDHVILFSSPTVRASRSIILAQATRCLAAPGRRPPR